MPFKRLILTDFKCELTRLAKKKELSAALQESGEGSCRSCKWFMDEQVHG